MENYLIQITNYLLTQSWQIAVLVVVIAVVSLALKNKSAHVRYLLWLIVLAKCLVPPLLTVPLAILPQEKPAAAALERVDTTVAEPRVSPSAPVAMSATPTLTERPAKVTIHQWLGFAWIVGAAAFLLFALIKALRTNFWLRRRRKPLPVELQSYIGNLLPSLGFGAFPKVWLVEGIGQPFVWGLLRGSIYLPGDFVKADNAEHSRDVLGHELSHVLRFDAAVNILQVIAQAIFWFHPFVWWANKRIRAEREKCCDEMAIAHLDTKARDYSNAIVNTLITEYESTRPVPSLAIAGPVKNIEERIKTVMKPGKKFYKRPSTIVVITILLLAALAVPTTLALTKRESDPRTRTAQSANLEVLDVKFEPIRQGKNVVRVKVQNTSEEEQMFRVHIYTRSPDYGRSGVGWGTPFFERIKPEETKWTRFVFKIQGPITNATYIRLTFHNPGPAETFDKEKWWAQNKDRQTHLKKTTYKSSQLKKHRTDGKLPTPALKKYHEAIIAAFRQIQDHIKDENYEQAWKLFTKDYQDAEYQRRDALERFKRAMEPAHPIDSAFLWEKDDFLNLQPKTVVERDGMLTLTATCEDQSWTIEFVQEDGQWKMDWIAGYRPRILQWQNWEERLLATMEKRSTKHFDIYYFRDSTAEKEIDQIAEQKEKGFQEVCRFLGKGSDVRIRMVLFEDGQTKHRETGHQGMGWAYGNTIVEVYNEKEKLDPYHETTHILMHPYGNPPALFNEGFAVYISERLGAQALKNLGGGLARIHQRTAELKEKGQWIELEELVTYTEIGSRKTQPSISYAEAASFVKFLIDKYGKDKFLRAYKALKNSDDKRVHRQNREKLADIYGRSLEQLENQWQAALATSPSPNSFPKAVPEGTNAGKSLHQAAADGDIERVKSLIAKGVDINARDKEGRTALTLAKEKEHKEIVILLRMHEAKEDSIKIDARFLLVSSDAREVMDLLERENLEPSQIPGDPNSRWYLLNAGQVEQILELARLNAEYKLLMNPTLEVVDGGTAIIRCSGRVNYVSGYSEPNRPSEVPKPIQDSVEIGDRAQVKPKLLPDGQDTMEVYFDFVLSNFTGYEKFMYKEKYPYKIPIIQKIAVAGHYKVASGETMLLCGWKITSYRDDGRTEKKEQDLLVLITTQKVEPKNAQDEAEIVELRGKNGAKE